MATIIVEDGTGISNSNSYVTLAEADQYFSDTGNLGWAGTDDFKNQNLINATAAMDATYGQRYLSYLRDNTTQALLWPRHQVWDRHARRINQGTIPQSLKNAQCEMAILAQNGVNLYPEGSADHNTTSESVTIGEISESKTYSRPAQDTAQYDGFRKVEQILWPILLPTTRNMRFAI
jgi:hypothetical protein